MLPNKSEIRRKIGGIKEKIAFYQKELLSLQNQSRCDHRLYETAGESASVTGPTGLYVECRMCDFSKMIGHYERSGKVYHRKSYEGMVGA